MFLAQNWQFFHFFFIFVGRGNVFDDILEQKKNFLGDKNKKFKIGKIDIFPKGLVHGFGGHRPWKC